MWYQDGNVVMSGDGRWAMEGGSGDDDGNTAENGGGAD